VVVLPNIGFTMQFATNACWSPNTVGPLPVDIPAGTRIAARMQASITDATDRLMDVIVYGID
jgi:hypothetical protein